MNAQTHDTKTDPKSSDDNRASDTPIAVIKTGGKQYVVSKGDVFQTEVIPEKEVGDEVTFDQVLLTDDGGNTDIDPDNLDDQEVTGEIVERGKAEKIEIIRFHPKTRHTRRQGHRQEFMKIKITSL